MQTTVVRFERGSESFLDLVRRTTGVPGVYVFATNATVLRVGESENLGSRLGHHLATGYGSWRSEYPHYFDFFEPLVGRDLRISWMRVDGSKGDRLCAERAVIDRQPVIWEPLKKARSRGENVDFRSAVMRVLEVVGEERHVTLSQVELPPTTAPAPAVAAASSGNLVLGSGGIPREAQRVVLNRFPELEEYSLSKDRLNWRLRADGRVVAREFAATGNGYVWGREIQSEEYEVDARGWVNVRRFSADELRRIVEQALRTMKK